MTTQGVELPEAAGSDDLERGGNPLRYFKGRFIGSGDDPQNPRLVAVPIEGREAPIMYLNFLEVDLDSLVCIVPYMYSTAQVAINYRVGVNTGKVHERSVWGMLLASLQTRTYTRNDGTPHAPGDSTRMQDVFGQVLEMKSDPNHRFGEDDEGQPIVGMTWEVLSVLGKDGTGQAAGPPETVDEAAIKLLKDGMDRTAFTQEALRNATLRTVNSTIVDGSLIAGLVARGKVKEEDGLFKPV